MAILAIWRKLETADFRPAATFPVGGGRRAYQGWAIEYWQNCWRRPVSEPYFGAVLGLPIMLFTVQRERDRVRRTRPHRTGICRDRLLTWRGALGAGALTLGGLTTAAGGLHLQAPTPITLSPGTLGPAFSKVEAVRELQDGRTLVVDTDERELAVVDWNSLEATTIGRAGDGPGEYRYPGQLVALRGDSTLLTDRQTGKWFLLYRDRIIAMLTADRPWLRFLGPILAGADTMGRVLVLHGSHFSAQVGRPRGGAGTTEIADSIAVILGSRDNANADTIARIRGAFRGQNRVRARVDNQTIVYLLGNPLAAGDQALLFPDGWIATVFVAPYHVEWRPPSGAMIRGQPLPYSPQAVDERVKRQAIDDRWPPSRHIPKWSSTDFPAWPDVVPPFLKNALISLPDGRVAVKRTSLGTNRTIQYDIVDRRGFLSGVLRLPPNERLVGFGKRSAYVVVDSDHNELLRRHVWP